MRARRFSWVVLALALLVGSLVPLSSSTPARAYSTTPTLCDSVPKYWCTYTGFEWSSTVATSVARYWKGAKGSETMVQWQLWWLQDWTCSSYPTCTWLRNYGQQAWATNSPLSSATWNWISGNDLNQDALVNMKLRYDDRYWDGVTWRQHIWCSPQLDHYIWNYNSAEVGTSSC